MMDGTPRPLTATGLRVGLVRPLALVLVVLFGVQVAPAPAEAAFRFVAGTCTMTLRARMLSAQEIEIRTPSAGMCVLASETALSGTASFAANVFRVTPLATFSCEKIVATTATGSMFVDGDPEGAWGGDSSDVTVTAEAGVIEITLIENTKLAAVGTFVQTAPTVVDNCTDFETTWEWQGAFVFEDPIID